MPLDLVLAGSFAAKHGVAAAHLFASVDTAAAAKFLDSVDAKAATSLMTHMNPLDAARCVRGLNPAKAAELLQSLGHQRCLLILRRLDHQTCNSILPLLPNALASKVERRLRYPEGTAGWLADSSAYPLAENLRAAEARQQGLDPRFPYIYLVDAEQKLVGAVHVNDILTCPDHEILTALAKPIPVRVSARTSVAELRRHRAWTQFDVLPVVDSRGVYLGALRHRVLRQLRVSHPARDNADTSLVSMLELAEMYWRGLSSVFLPVSGGVASAIIQEPPHES